VTEPLLLGIDVGTTCAKVGVFQLDGRPAAMRVAPYSYAKTSDGNVAEQDACEWWSQVQNALRATLAQIDVNALRGVCVGGQGPTLVAVDESLTPVAPALTWMDQRAIGQVRLLSERLERNVPSHSFLAKAMWLNTSRPEVYANTRWFCQAWDYVASQLVGEAVVSTAPGIAPWDDELLAASELDAKKFPTVQQLGQILGYVTAEAAEITGLPKNLPVVGGISDYFGGILGSGAVTRGVACDNGGTSSSFNVCWDNELQVQGIFCMPSFETGYWYIGGPASTTGRALDWWRREILDADDWTIVNAAANVSPGSERLIFLPYLAGERAPLWDAEARGVMFGLSLHHSRAHLTRAILEGVAYALRHIMEQIERAGATIQEIHCCGGQAASELWCQIKADVTGRRVIVPEVIEAPVLGSAIIAGVGVGVLNSFREGACQMMRVRRVIEPDMANHERYQEFYALFRELYTAVQPLYPRLHKTA